MPSQDKKPSTAFTTSTPTPNANVPITAEHSNETPTSNSISERADTLNPDDEDSTFPNPTREPYLPPFEGARDIIEHLQFHFDICISHVKNKVGTLDKVKEDYKKHVDMLLVIIEYLNEEKRRRIADLEDTSMELRMKSEEELQRVRNKVDRKRWIYLAMCLVVAFVAVTLSRCFMRESERLWRAGTEHLRRMRTRD